MSENNQNQETVILSQAELVTVNRMTDEIRKDLAAAQQSLLRACIRIAEVRDRKLYKLLKCRNFEEYCEKCLGIKRNQGLKYAAIGSYLKNAQSTVHSENVSSTIHFQEKFFQQLSVEKLYLIAKADDATREQAVRDADITNMTVRELKERISEIEQQNALLSGKIDETKAAVVEQVGTLEKTVRQLIEENAKEQAAAVPAPEEENPKKPSFILYSNYIRFIRDFTDEEAGQLLKAILCYVNNVPVPTLAKGVRTAYTFLTDQINRDFIKWSEIRKKRSESGRKGGLQTQKKARPENQANACFALANQAVNVSVNDNVNVNENVSVSVNQSGGDKKNGKSTTHFENAQSTVHSDGKTDGFSKQQEYTDIIRKNIEYDDFRMWAEESDGYMTPDELDEIVRTLVRTVCSGKNVSVCGQEFPHEIVKAALLKVDRTCIENAIEQMKQAGNIRNYEKYLVSTLFNEANNRKFRENAEGRSIDYSIRHDLG